MRPPGTVPVPGPGRREGGHRTPDHTGVFLGWDTPVTGPHRGFSRGVSPTPDRTGGFLGGGGTGTGPHRVWRPVSYFLKKIGKRTPIFHFVNHPEVSDVYIASILEFAQDMYYKQTKNNDHGYHYGTVNVLNPHRSQRLPEIERWSNDVHN